MKKYIAYILIICIVLSITGCVSNSNQVAEKAVKVLHSYLNAEITAQIAFGKLDVIHDELGENPKKDGAIVAAWISTAQYELLQPYVDREKIEKYLHCLEEQAQK